MGAEGVVSEEPVVSLPVVAQSHQIALVSVVTGTPVIGLAYFNVAQGRAVNVSDRSYNVVDVADSANRAIISQANKAA